MTILEAIGLFFGGAFLTNAIPHGVAGLMGEPFRTPFANPPGKGLSSPMVNVLWTAFNLFMAWLLLVKLNAFDIRAIDQAAVFGVGALVMSLVLSRTRT